VFGVGTPCSPIDSDAGAPQREPDPDADRAVTGPSTADPPASSGFGIVREAVSHAKEQAVRCRLERHPIDRSREARPRPCRSRRFAAFEVDEEVDLASGLRRLAEPAAEIVIRSSRSRRSMMTVSQPRVSIAV
jgi:hypothetical protein